MRRDRRDGFALMAALWLVVIIGTTGYELSVRSRARRLAVANSLEKIAADAAADAELETVRATLENRLLHPLDSRTQLVSDANRDPWSHLEFAEHDTLHLEFERGTMHVYDAGSRLQINHATENDVFRLLTALRIDAGVASGLAQRILDWRDADDFRRARGAERAEYLAHGARVLPTNTDFGRLEELRDIEGMTAELYSRIAPYLTVLGSGQININSASPVVLRSLPGMSDDVVEMILRARTSTRPFRTLEELTNALSSGARAALVEAGSELMQRVTFETQEVAVESEGWVDGSPLHSHAEAVYARSGDALFTIWHRAGR